MFLPLCVCECGSAWLLYIAVVLRAHVTFLFFSLFLEIFLLENEKIIKKEKNILRSEIYILILAYSRLLLRRRHACDTYTHTHTSQWNPINTGVKTDFTRGWYDRWMFLGMLDGIVERLRRWHMVYFSSLDFRFINLRNESDWSIEPQSSSPM